MNSNSTVSVIDQFYIDTTYIKQGYVLFWVPTRSNRNSSDTNIFVGGVYESGNCSRSFIHLNTIGPFNGNLSLENSNAPNIGLIIYNYLNSLIPGQYPPISGPLDSTQSYYNLEELQDLTIDNENTFFCKILGLGTGDITSYQVANVNQNGVSALAENFTGVPRDVQDFLFQDFLDRLVLRNTTNAKTTWYSNILPSYQYPLTQNGVSQYLQQFDWESRFGISYLNGTNTFPTFGWAGGRIGSIIPSTNNNNQPNLLENIQSNFPIGIIYAGQGVQLSSFPWPYRRIPKTLFERNRTLRIFQEKINNRQNANIFEQIRVSGVQPYQQGRGIIEYVSREQKYNEIGNISSNVIISTFPPEGSIPGRNNAFLGVALTDYWSSTLNMNNQQNSSLTPHDTRYQNGIAPTKIAHNAPMVYESDVSNNTYNPLPWNNLMGYVGTTTSSASNKYSENTPILNRGITSMIIGGAYPLYRGSNSSEFSGSTAKDDISLRYFATFKSQYYLTEDFWDPNFENPDLSTEISGTSVLPTPPYIIKGERIVLYEGQRINAGSYVYVNVHMTGNVNLSKFFGASAKEIILQSGGILNQNIYSKYQSNQGGLIVIVTHGRPVPMIPPCCQPIGIILEDIIGFGNPPEESQIVYQKQTSLSSGLQTVPDFENTKQIQNQEVLIQLFPMYASQVLSGFPSTELITTSGDDTINVKNIPYGTTVSSIYLNPTITFSDTVDGPYAPMYRNIRTNYMIQDGKYTFYISYVIYNFQEQFPIFHSLKDKQQSLDWPYPEAIVAEFP